MIRLMNWCRGWRMELDGYWVRARRAGDPDLEGHGEIGFTEEACIVARDPILAYLIDSGFSPGVVRRLHGQVMAGQWWVL